MTAIADLVDQRHILICCGTGGVGKTTTAATLAIEGARRGRDSVVVTIDPAKRLAQVVAIQKQLELDAARPTLDSRLDYFTVWPHVKNMVPHNNIFNFGRMQEVWRDK